MLLILLAVEVFADVFSFDVPNRNFSASDDKIGVAALSDVGRFVGNVHLRRKGAEQVFQISAVAVFFCDAALVLFIDLLDVVVQSHNVSCQCDIMNSPDLSGREELTE